MVKGIQVKINWRILLIIIHGYKNLNENIKYINYNITIYIYIYIYIYI